MLNIMTDRLVPPGLLNRPFADLRFETAPHPSAKRAKIQPESSPPSNNTQPGIDTAAFLAELAGSAPCRVHPIPIHPPR
jgi:hypothetical protein